ncbi:MAG: sigma-54-dependent Fis family transcriptional regulator [Candidatus Hydrogenedentes bacterium]|nr:sigma-54-dependent Fis family transcriptional regulator [Candidatus Hydrogenedentota bacterium]
MDARILVVDDEQLIRWSLCRRLGEEGYVCIEAEDGASARARADEGSLDLALLDIRLPDVDGMTLLTQLRERHPHMRFVVITAHSTVNGAVEAMKIGAHDYVAKPFNMDGLVLTVRNVLEASGLERRLVAEVGQQKARFGLSNVVGDSEVMAHIRDLVRKVARSETTTILLLGESGTGKDMVARAIHYESARVEMPFMNITCTALPETLLDSELFGYEKGAFTDAKEQKKGLFELADGGSVFLDEVGDMSSGLQAKLLRVLEDKIFRRIGGREDIRLDVRVIAATNRDLQDAIDTQVFREDLYYRLSAMPIVLPPLRERIEDVPLLARHFLAQCNRELHRAFRDFSPEAVQRLLDYPWPGNVRELRNVVERAVLLSSGEVIALDDIHLGRSAFRPRPANDEQAVRLPQNGCNLSDVERDLIRQALERTNWNQTQSAKLLGLTRDQVRYKMAKYRLSEP